ncbi:hypothetical protein [Rickettsia slovaca]
MTQWVLPVHATIPPRNDDLGIYAKCFRKNDIESFLRAMRE